jgi:hypothetical protein
VSQVSQQNLDSGSIREWKGGVEWVRVGLQGSSAPGLGAVHEVFGSCAVPACGACDVRVAHCLWVVQMKTVRGVCLLGGLG